MSTNATYAPLTVYQTNPLNAGTPLEVLRSAFITPNNLFFIRSHGSLPTVNRETYQLVIDGMVQQRLEFSLADLLARFVSRTMTATLVCAGNRRNELAAVHPLPGEILWGADAISTASWRGVRLSEVLQVAGIGAEARYVAFRGLDETEIEGKRVPFGSSIRLEKALASEVLLVYEMNGAPLAPEHGFPLRVLIPGYVGARSVKWLREITLQSRPSTSYFQARDYKTFPPDITAETVNWAQGKTLEELKLNSVICAPREGETRKAGLNIVQGYAMTGEGAPIERIELSLDCGATWIAATITAQTNHWTWCFWEARLDLPVGDYQIVVRTWDTAGKTQAEDREALWNFKGYANNAWHQVCFHLV